MTYILILILILVTAEYLSATQVLTTQINKIKSLKLRMCILHFISGILPIPGRICVVNALFDSITNKDKTNTKFSFFHYLSTHHYYLWSPLEKTIIIPITSHLLKSCKNVTNPY